MNLNSIKIANFYLVLSELPAKTVPVELALDGYVGCAVWLVILKGIDENSIFLKVCNLYTFQFHILSCSSCLQFARVLILLWAPVLNLLLSKKVSQTNQD